MDEYTKYALCALSFFRGRWEKKPRHKKSVRRKPQYVTDHARSCHMARHYIAKARQARA